MRLQNNEKLSNTKNNDKLIFDIRDKFAEPLLTKKDVSILFNISLKMVDRLVSTRKIPYIKLGRLVRFERQAITRWLLERSNNGN